MLLHSNKWKHSSPLTFVTHEQSCTEPNQVQVTGNGTRINMHTKVTTSVGQQHASTTEETLTRIH